MGDLMSRLQNKTVLIIHTCPKTKDINDLVENGVGVVVLGKGFPKTDILWGIEINPFDHDELINGLNIIVKSTSIDAVIPIWEATVIESAIATEYLGLRGNSKEAVINARNKYLLATILAKHNIPTPKSFLVKTLSEASLILEEMIGYPCIAKLPFSANSQSVIKINSMEELKKQFSQIMEMHLADTNPYIQSFIDRNSVTNAILIQEYIEGKEVNLDIAYLNNQYCLLGIFQKAPMNGPCFGEYRSMYPTTLSEKEIEECERIAKKAIASTGAVCGCAHVEIKYGKGGPVIIELSLRPGGAYTMWAIELVSGINEMQILSKILLDGILTVNKKKNKKACIYAGLIIEKSGYITNIQNTDIFKNIPEIVDYSILYKNGDYVECLPKGSQIHLAHFIMVGDSIDTLLEQDSRIRRMVTYSIKELP